MIIKFLGHTCDEEQVEMMYEAKNIMECDAFKLRKTVEEIQAEEDWEDSDYEEVIEEAFNRCGIEATPIFADFEIQM